MTGRLRYFAQPFWSDRLATAEPYEFTCALDAEDGGRILFTEADGVLVYQQWIDAETALFDDPEVLLILGAVPRAAIAIDSDGRDPWLDDAA